VNRQDIADILAPLRKGHATLMGPGLVAYPIAQNGDEPMTIYNMEMAYVTATSLGVALGWPAIKVLALEGDGSLLMGSVALTTVGRYQPPNLIIIVFDNGAYLTTGSGRATTATTVNCDIEQMGRAAGIKNTATVSEPRPAREVIERAFSEPGPWLIVTKIDQSDRERSKDYLPLPTDCFEAGQRFHQAALARGAPHSRPSEAGE
jgi:pyruvate/2-oxoacid:ferredoxin oxidoreductase beta subunit